MASEAARRWRELAPEGQRHLEETMAARSRSSLHERKALQPDALVVLRLRRRGLTAPALCHPVRAAHRLQERRLMGPTEVRDFVNSLRSTFSSFEARMQILVCQRLALLLFRVLEEHSAFLGLLEGQEQRN